MSKEKDTDSATPTESEGQTEQAQSVTKPRPKQIRLAQSVCPLHTLEEAVKVPRAIKDNYAGQPTDPLLVAPACGFSPASSTWRTLSGAAIAYGLTEGGYNSKEIAITPLGERVVAPLIQGDDVAARREASLIPSVLGAFFRQYDRNRFPREDIAKNVLAKNGVPAERLNATYSIIRENGKNTDMIQVLSGSEYVRLGSTGSGASSDASIEVVSRDTSGPVTEPPDELLKRLDISKPSPSAIPVQEASTPALVHTPRVFISHGKDGKVVLGQLKELLSYGQLEPVISVERETTAIPVPDKVFDDMRSCSAGIIHVGLEPLTDSSGASYNGINENVLIEIGAAIALYGKRVVILCKRGTALPSNLQGLYRCEYDGDQLDYSATMKLLKTMQELRSLM